MNFAKFIFIYLLICGPISFTQIWDIFTYDWHDGWMVVVVPYTTTTATIATITVGGGAAAAAAAAAGGVFAAICGSSSARASVDRGSRGGGRRGVCGRCGRRPSAITAMMMIMLMILTTTTTTNMMMTTMVNTTTTTTSDAASLLNMSTLSVPIQEPKVINCSSVEMQSTPPCKSLEATLADYDNNYAADNSYGSNDKSEGELNTDTIAIDHFYPDSNNETATGEYRIKVDPIMVYTMIIVLTVIIIWFAYVVYACYNYICFCGDQVLPAYPPLPAEYRQHRRDNGGGADRPPSIANGVIPVLYVNGNDERCLLYSENVPMLRVPPPSPV